MVKPERPWRVLLMDNDPSSLQQARDTLAAAREAVYLLDCLPDASRALEALDSAAFDAVVVDDHIGAPAALDFIRAARDAGCNTPIIFITGSGDPQADQQAMQAGASDYLNRAEITPALFERTIRYDIHSHLLSLEAERIAQVEQSRLSTVIENAPSGILMTDAQGNFTVINPEAQKLFPNSGITGSAAGPSGGYTLLRMDGTAFATDDLPLVRTLKGEIIRNEEMIIRHDDGRQVYALINTTPIRHGEKILGAVGAIRDMTDFLQANRDLAVSQNRELAHARELEAIMNAVPAAVWIARDPECKMIDSNRYGYEILRMRPGVNTSKSADEAALTTHFKVVKDGRELAPEELPVQVAARGTPVYDYDYDIVFDDGEVVHMFGNAVPMLEDGAPVGAVSAILNITQRKTFEQALALSEERFRLATNALNGFVWDYNLVTGYVYRSEGVADVIGYSSTELAPNLESWRELMNPQDSNPMMASLLAGGAPPDTHYEGSEYRVRHKDGRWVWVRSHGRVFYDQHGKPVRMVGTTINITAEKEAALALSESNERFQLASSALRGFVWDYNLVSGEIYRSEGIADVVGYTNAALSATRDSWTALIHPEDNPPDRESAARFFAEHENNYTGEYRVRHKDNYWVWVREQGKIIRDAHGKPVRVVGTTINITAEKEASLALIESNERFRLVLDNTPTTIFTMDTDLRYTWIYNPREDFAIGNVIGKRDDELLEAEAAAILMAPKREALETGQPVRRELVYQLRGRTVAYNVAIEPIFSADGKVTALSVVSMDVTDLVMLRTQQVEDQAHIGIQRRLIQQREQERLQIARDLHDGPLQTFTAALYGMQGLMEYAVELPEMRKDLDLLKGDMQSAIAELRAFASELRPPTLVSFGLEKAIDAHLKEFRGRNPGIQVHFEARQTGDILPEGPRLAMYRIYQELLNNVVKHAGATQIHIRFLKTLTDAELVIEDNGKGFAPPRDWLELARNKHLGLVGVRERAEAVGGSVEIWSSVGRGTTVRVYIPLEGPG